MTNYTLLEDDTPLLLKMIVSGTGGTGKTYTALTIANVIDPSFIVIDTEAAKSRKLYRHLFPKMRTLDVRPPFSPKVLSDILIDCVLKFNATCIVVDSFSDFWAGPGGALDKVGETNKTFTEGWRHVTPELNNLTGIMTRLPAHLIVTVQEKPHYVLELDEKGRQIPRRVGLEPVMRDKTDYWSYLWLQMNERNNGIMVKSNLDTFPVGTVVEKPGVAFASILTERLSNPSVAWPTNAATSPEVFKALLNRYTEQDKEIELLKQNWSKNCKVPPDESNLARLVRLREAELRETGLRKTE